MENLPNFIMIGPGRTGTTWIYEALREHPEVSLAKGIKETNYYNHEYERGIDWYQSFFANSEGKKAIGEISNLYFYDENVPKRIKIDIPNVKLITCLRNPIERLESAYFFKIRGGEIDPNVSLSEAIIKFPDLVTDNLYYSKIKSYLNEFDPSQIKIMFYEDLKSKPREFAKETFEFLGIDPDFIPSVIDQTVNASAKIRFKSATKLIDSIANNLRKYQLHSILDFLKRNRIVKRIVLKDVKKSDVPKVSKGEKEELLIQFKPEIEKIEELTKRDLSSWM